jgi:hypothetical protein
LAYHFFLDGTGPDLTRIAGLQGIPTLIIGALDKKLLNDRLKGFDDEADGMRSMKYVSSSIESTSYSQGVLNIRMLAQKFTNKVLSSSHITFSVRSLPSPQAPTHSRRPTSCWPSTTR